ncbi:MAG: UDP-glucose 4-epimerase GalE [Phycisphaerales bacterium]|nr:UDP-glucose 4-epimerase GalE [Phycisphaerales bacterium]
MNVLVTGGAGYIGSHAVKFLRRAGHEVVVVDNLSRGFRAAVTGETPLVVHELCDWRHMARILRGNAIDCVMHFAALAYVGESVDDPLRYYRNNAAHAIELLHAMRIVGVQKFVFSSTCATYGEPRPEHIPISEDCPQQPINPYGWSKYFVERVLADYSRANPDFSCAVLRYFNVAGSDREHEIGEAHDPETHLIPIILQAALGLRPHVEIFGTDYPTPDGTCIRDYIHVEDLIDAHILCMDRLQPGKRFVFNLGIGKGYSVRDIINATQRVTGKKIKVIEGPRRPGDPPRLFADPSRIRRELGWSAKITEIDDIIASAWGWYSRHPNGYAGRLD